MLFLKVSHWQNGEDGQSDSPESDGCGQNNQRIVPGIRFWSLQLQEVFIPDQTLPQNQLEIIHGRFMRN
jgi:hypothetical protein